VGGDRYRVGLAGRFGDHFLMTWWHLRRRERTADVTVYFHWMIALSEVKLVNGESRTAGYTLVLWNRGPSEAKDVAITVYGPDGKQRTLADTPQGEFPLERLDSGALYPIPWLLDDDSQGESRLFTVDVSWHDGNGMQRHKLPLRRGQTGA